MNYHDNSVTLYNSDCRDMAELSDESIQVVVTSPPYWGLRKYAGLPDLVWGGDEDCQHIFNINSQPRRNRGNLDIVDPNSKQATNFASAYEATPMKTCSLCGAWQGQLGLEPTPELYISHLIEIFREVRRVLRKDGVCFVNCGDSYYASGGAHKPEHANPGLSKSAQRGGVPRGKQNGKRGKVLQDLRGDGVSLENPCDECAKVLLNHNLGIDGRLGQAPETLGELSNHSHKEQQIAHSESLDLAFQGDHNANGTSGLYSVLSSAGVVVPCAQESTNPVSFGQLQDEGLRDAKSASSLDEPSVPSHGFQECEHRKVCPFWQHLISLGIQGLTENISGTLGIVGASAVHKQGKVSGYSSYPYYTITQHQNQLKPKDLCLIPFRLAIALQMDSWYVRSVIIWNKPNPMPESVKDRPTESHEYILMLTKSARYYWDAEAVREQHETKLHNPGNKNKRFGEGGHWAEDRMDKIWGNPTGRNLRSVWEFSTQPYPEAHFATYPEELVRRCVLAATPEVGCCPKCGKPWVRIVESYYTKDTQKWWKDYFGEEQRIRVADISELRRRLAKEKADDYEQIVTAELRVNNPVSPKEEKLREILNRDGMGAATRQTETLGWKPQCKCGLPQSENIGSIVLDPFAGSCTSLSVAKRLGRRAIGYELSQQYCALGVKRIEAETAPMRLE